jgi:hypothetical protein
MAEITLLCVKEYGNQFIHVMPGQTITLDTEKATWTMRDGPDCFMVLLPEVKEIEAPPVDKMIHKARKIK